jgi:hypothetical protein
MKTLFINKLAPCYKDYILSQEPDILNMASNVARAMWKRKNPDVQSQLQLKNYSMVSLRISEKTVS